jgi:spermidine/putrescine-binding protein
MQLADNPNVKFIIPEDGGMRWNDNMAITKGSTEHIDETHQLIDYWYSLDAAALLSEYIGYFSGVAGVKDRILEDAQAARDAGDSETAIAWWHARSSSPRPTVDNTYPDKQLSEDEESQWNDLFLVVLGG